MILAGTQIPKVEALMPMDYAMDFSDGRASIVGRTDVKCILTNPIDIFDEMTRQGCKLNLITFGYYMEK